MPLADFAHALAGTLNARPLREHAEPSLSTVALPAGWRPAPAPTSVLRACGWLAPDVPAASLRVDQTTSSHTVFRVTAPDGRCVIVKQVSRNSALNSRSLRNELFVYRLCAWMPAIAAIVPEPIYLDEARQVVVVHSLASGAVWPDPATTPNITTPGVAEEVATAVAQLHRSTQDMGMWPSFAVGVLGLCDSLDLAIQGRAPTACALMRTIVADGALNALLREGLQTYRARCVIHGDLRSENWLRDCRSPRRELRLLDWEIAGAGDPLWDLGSLLAETVGHHIRCNHPVDAIWPPLCHATLSQILRSYAAANGPIDLADSDVWRRLAVMAAARLLHVATECAEQGAEPGDWPVAALLQAASAVAGDPNGAGAGLARLVSPR